MNKLEVEKLNQELKWLRLFRIEDNEDGLELIFGGDLDDELFKLSLFYGAGDVGHKLIDLSPDSSNLGGTRHTCNIGRELLTKFKMLIGSQVTLEKDGRSKTWPRDPKRPSRVQLDLSNWQHTLSEKVDFVASTGFDGLVTIDRGTVERLKLEPAPGRVALNSVWSSVPIICSLVKLRIRIPEMEFDEQLIAAVMPVDGDTF